jgi:hypothetical protein
VILMIGLAPLTRADSTVQEAQQELKEQGYYFGQINGRKTRIRSQPSGDFKSAAAANHRRVGRTNIADIAFRHCFLLCADEHAATSASGG